MKPDITVQELLEAAAELLEEPLRDWSQSVNGADHLVVAATTGSGARVVIKAGSEANVDAAVLRRLEATGTLAPRLIAHGAIGAATDRTFLSVMTFIEGTLLAEVTDRPLHHYLVALIEAMASVHRETTTKGAGPALGMSGSSRSWREYLLMLLTGGHPEFDWDKVAGSHGVDASVLQRALRLVIERVEALPTVSTAHLLHGDLNPHNVIVRDGAIGGIVDWSYARFGDPLFDFARLRINSFIRASPEALDLYFAHLNLTPAEREREETYYLFNLVEYVNWYVLDDRPEGVTALMGLLAEILSAQ